MSKWVWIAMTGLTACRGAGPPRPASSTTAPPVDAPAALYARMFVVGATFVYDVTSVQESPESKSERAAAATCQVTDVSRDGDGMVSVIRCDGERFVGVDGEWYADGRGLWRDHEPEDRTLDTAVMRAPPVAFHRQREDPGQPERDATEAVAENEHGWCWLSATALGHESWTQICFADGAIAYVENGTCGYECLELHVRLRDR